MKERYPIAIAAALCFSPAMAQLVVDETMAPAELLNNVLLGGGVSVSNVTYNGVPAPATPQVGSGSFTYTGTELGLPAGIILSTGEISSAVGPADDNFSSDPNGTGSDPDLVAVAANDINDQAVLEFDFIPTGDSLSFRYVFASEEYPVFVCSQFNDAFGFFLSGPGISGPYSNNAINIALIPDTDVPVTINTVNSGTAGGSYDPATCALADPNWQANSVYFVDNEGGQHVAFGGYTVVLEAKALVQCGETYHIKLAIGDASDSAYDSAVFLEAGSFASTGQVIPSLEAGIGVIGNTMMAGCNPVELVFVRQGDLSNQDTIAIAVGGTATAGVDYSPALPTELIFTPGQETHTVTFDVPNDGDPEETMVIEITQLIECAGSYVETTFTFNIVNPDPITVDLDDIDSSCGEEHLLAPVITGGTGNFIFEWSTGDTTEQISVSPGVTTVYDLTVSDQCDVDAASASSTITLPVYPPLELTVSPATEVDCEGTVQIGVEEVSGGDGVFTYEWSPPGLGAGNTASIEVEGGPPTWYVVTVSEGCGTSIQDSVLVTYAPLPPLEITVSEPQTVICPGDEAVVELYQVTGGNGEYNIAWTDQNGQLLGTEPALPVIVNGDAAYTVTVTDGCLTQGTAIAEVVLPVYDQLQFNLPADMTICAGDSVELYAAVTGGSGYYFIEWHDLEYTDPLFVASPLEETQYTVTVTDQCGATLSDQVVIDVEHPWVEIQAETTGQDDWRLRALSSPGTVSWLWDLGDGTRARGEQLAHSYLDLDEHWVHLSINTVNGCEAVDSMLLRPPAHLYFPNAFTPDGDGHNDKFGPIGHSIDQFELMVFDRWGEQIFQSDDANVLWDGTVDGEIAATGVYVYRYKATGHHFPTVEGFGHVTLLAGEPE